MSKRVQANAALVEARAARSSGYKTKIHTPAFAEYKQWLDSELQKGGKSVNLLHRESKTKFPKLNVPSVPTLKNYVEKYYEPPTVTIPSYAPDYIRAMEKFDSYLKMLEFADECWEQYKHACELAKVSPLSTAQKNIWADRYMRVMQSLVEIEIKLKLRNAVAAATTPALQQFNDNRQIHITGNGPVADLEHVEEVQIDTERVNDWAAKLAEFRNSGGGAGSSEPVTTQ